jgi:hypothetical protein
MSNFNHTQQMQIARELNKGRKKDVVTHTTKTNDYDLLQCMTVRKAHISHLRVSVGKRDVIR